MSTKPHLSRMTIDLPEQDHKKLKALAAVLGKSMREIVSTWIHNNLSGTKLPNKKTLKAIKSVEEGRDLIEAKDAEDLFKKLGI